MRLFSFTGSIFQQYFSFFLQVPDSENILSLKLREEARTVFLQKKSKELLDNNELQVL